MSNSQRDLAALSRFVFRAPDWSASLFLTLLVAAVAGVAAFDSGFVLDDAYLGMVYVGVPTVIAAFLTPWVDRPLGGRLTYNRSALLAFLCELLVVVAIVVAAAAVAVTGLGAGTIVGALVVSLASMFAVRLFVVLAVSRQSLPVAAIPASIQPVAAAVLVFLHSDAARHLGFAPAADIPFVGTFAAPVLDAVRPVDFALLLALCAIYAVAVYGFLIAIDRPWRRSLGVSVLDFVRGFIGHIADGSTELESFFEELGETAVVPVSALVVRQPDGTEKARFVAPMVHPGPMGDIGGGNLPARLDERASGLSFPLHGTAGHDFNLVTERAVEPVVDAVDDAVEAAGEHEAATGARRTTVGDSTLVGQAVGDGAFAVITHAPEPADDIAFGVGLGASGELRASGFETALVADAHNCNGEVGDGPGQVTPGSRRAGDIQSAAGELGAALSAADSGPLSVGVAVSETDWKPTDGIGPLGVRVAVFDTDGDRTAYVLVDGNNMVPGLRERIQDALAANTVEVATTDTHVVNTVEATNRVGDALDGDELVALVQSLEADATADLEPVVAGVGSTEAETTVFGTDRTETLASTANAMVQLGGVLLLVVVGAVLTVSLLVVLLAG